MQLVHTSAEISYILERLMDGRAIFTHDTIADAIVRLRSQPEITITIDIGIPDPYTA